MRQKSQKAVKKKKITQSTERNMVTIKYERDVVGGKRIVKTICSICFEDLKPFAQDLQAISICGHVFHEPWSLSLSLIEYNNYECIILYL